MRSGGLSPDTPTLAPLAGLERLNGEAAAPIAVAFSGGGDSLALLLLANTWADGAGRRLLALTVDHGLQSASADWSRFAAERARRLGVQHQILSWTGPKPASGLPAAARAARHALLADAARDAGASVILLAHTGDDVLETALMRADGSSTPRLQLWSPSPAWPAGRGVFLLRPLLGQRRAALRAWLAAQGEAWIDDPANDDLRYARPRARRRLAGGCGGPLTISQPRAPPAGLDEVREGVGGDLTVPRSVVLAGDPGERRRFLGALALCAAGATRPPSSASLDRLGGRLEAGDDLVATLAGARIEARGDTLRICREAGERMRGGLASRSPPAGDSVFDGRFLLRALRGGYTSAPLAGLAPRLADAERARLASLPASVRGGLPAMIGPAGDVSSPVLAPGGDTLAVSLTLARLRAALGAVSSEAAASLASPAR